jgi:hypothetical protein
MPYHRRPIVDGFDKGGARVQGAVFDNDHVNGRQRLALAVPPRWLVQAPPW